MSNLTELAEQVLAAKADWENAKIELERAMAEFEYAERKLVLARQRLSLEEGRTNPGAAHAAQDEVNPEDAYRTELDSIELVGESIGNAAKKALRALKAGNLHALERHMRKHGFVFSTDAPARELHAALMRQRWARRHMSGVWEFTRDVD